LFRPQRASAGCSQGCAGRGTRGGRRGRGGGPHEQRIASQGGSHQLVPSSTARGQRGVVRVPPTTAQPSPLSPFYSRRVATGDRADCGEHTEHAERLAAAKPAVVAAPGHGHPWRVCVRVRVCACVRGVPGVMPVIAGAPGGPHSNQPERAARGCACPAHPTPAHYVTSRSQSPSGDRADCRLCVCASWTRSPPQVWRVRRAASCCSADHHHPQVEALTRAAQSSTPAAGEGGTERGTEGRSLVTHAAHAV
jgi:hypothetical protein